jgi:hypothetical protein
VKPGYKAYNHGANQNRKQFGILPETPQGALFLGRIEWRCPPHQVENIAFGVSKENQFAVF